MSEARFDVVLFLNADEEITAAAEGKRLLSVEPDGEPWWNNAGLLAVPVTLIIDQEESG